MLCGGCASQSIGDFTLLSTKTSTCPNWDEYRRVGSRQDAQDTRNVLQLYVGAAPSMEEAVDKAIEQVRGCRALVDVSVKAVSKLLSAGYEIEGKCLVDTSASRRN